MKSLKQLSVAERLQKKLGSTRQRREKGWRDTVKGGVHGEIQRYKRKARPARDGAGGGCKEGRVALPFDTVGAGCSDCETA